MMISRTLCGWGAATLLATTLTAQTSIAPRPNPLDQLVGRWRSDTVAGTSMAYHCEPSPIGTGLICHETLSHPAGVERWVGVYLPDSASQAYLYYELAGTGRPTAPTRLTITNDVWTFGGTAPGPRGSYERTVHDFSARNGTFSWRKESSRDGVHWTLEQHGVVHRMRPLVQDSDDSHQ
jgi:hypothetical protein